MTFETCPIVHVVIDPRDAGERADVVLGRRVAGLSRRVARALALEGRLVVDGRRAPPSTRVEIGQRLELRISGPSAGGEPVRERAPILAVDEAIVYVDKPAGIATHRLRPDEAPALVDLVAREHPECAAASPDPREGGAVHRLDRGTSGVVAIARSPGAWRAARAAFDAGAVGKLYAAIVTPAVGVGLTDDRARPEPLPAELCADLERLGLRVGTDPVWLDVRAPLGRGDGRSRVVVDPAGRPAHSRIAPLFSAAADVLVAVELRTGARHQARVHLQALGAPIVGDPAHGGAPGERLFLHAWRLDLGAAFAGAAPVVAPLPAAFPRRLAEKPANSPSEMDPGGFS